MFGNKRKYNNGYADGYLAGTDDSNAAYKISRDKWQDLYYKLKDRMDNMCSCVGGCVCINGTKYVAVETKVIDCREKQKAELVKTAKVTVKTPWQTYSIKQLETTDKSVSYWNFTDCPVIEINGGHGQTWIPLDVLKQIVAEYDVADEVKPDKVAE